jgi:hypothetical protein
MYWNVPRIVPCAVRLGAIVGAIVPLTETTGVFVFARPKSSNFAPAFVSMMSLGFRSDGEASSKKVISLASSRQIPARVFVCLDRRMRRRTVVEYLLMTAYCVVPHGPHVAPAPEDCAKTYRLASSTALQSS